MNDARIFFSCGFWAVIATLGCSAGSGGSDVGGGGSSLSGGSGGGVPLGGSGGSGGSGGGSTGGSAGGIPLGGNNGTGGSAGMPMVCGELNVSSKPVVPTVVILVDTSSSMWETMPPAWPLLHGALMDPATGVVGALESKIRFGFASFKGFKGTSEDDPACATIVTVDPALDNRAAIDAVYAPIDWPIDHPKWETPTSHAINRTAAALAAFNADPPGPKFILLVTDGNPNTCVTTDPQCGQDLSIKAAQDAYAQGIGLFAVGVGDIVAQPNNGCPTSARCGLTHLQDMANAGVGAPVQAPPGCADPTSPDCQYKYAGCTPDQLMKASYVATAPNVGQPFAVDTGGSNAQEQLKTALTGLLSTVVGCTFDMNAIVTGNPAHSIVTLNGTPLTFGDTVGGWTLEDNHYQVTLQGAACETFKASSSTDAGAALEIQFLCDDMGKPVAEPR